MLGMPSLLESRSDLVHLRTPLGWKRIQSKFQSMATGCSLNPALRFQEGATSWCSARQNWSTRRAFCGPPRAEEMYQKESWRNSGSFPTRSSISWLATQNWLDRAEVHRKGEVGTGRPLLPSIQRWIPEISKNSGISHWTNRARMRRCDFDRTCELAVSIMSFLHRKSGEEVAQPISPQQYRRWHPSSSSDSWWNWDTSRSWWSSWEFNSCLFNRRVWEGVQTDTPHTSLFLLQSAGVSWCVNLDHHRRLPKR